MFRLLRALVRLVFALILLVTFSGCTTALDEQFQRDRRAAQSDSAIAPTSAAAAGSEAAPSPGQPGDAGQPGGPGSPVIPAAPGAPFEPPKNGSVAESPLRIPKWGQSGLPFNSIKTDIENDIRKACGSAGGDKLCLNYAPEIDADSCETKGDDGGLITKPPRGTLVHRGSTIIFACNKAADDAQEQSPSESPEPE